MTLLVRRSSVDVPLLPAPQINSGFVELEEARFVIPGSSGWSLRVDDEELVKEDGFWIWRPDFFAGEVLAELHGPGVASKWRLDVSPDPSKLGRDRFEAMLDELISVEPAMIFGEQSSSLATDYGGLELPTEFDVLVALSRLRTWGGDLVASLGLIEHAPRQALLRERQRVPAHRARRFDVATLRHLARSPHLQRSRDQGGHLFSLSAGAELDVPVVSTTVDSAANRVVVELLRRVSRRIKSTHARLSELAARAPSPEVQAARSAKLPTRLAMLSGLDASIRERLRAPPWCDVSAGEFSVAGMTALTSDPLYARFAQIAWCILRTGLHVDDGRERMPLSPTWQIFERWCFVRLAQQLRHEWPSLSWSRCKTGGATAGWTGEGEGVSIDVLLQPRFAAWDMSSSSDFRSISREREPDLIVTMRRGDRFAWLVLDAKYRVRRPNVLAAMESAHIYRDSLRWRGVRPLLSLLLVPAPPEASWLTAADFQHAHSVGVVCFDGSLDNGVLGALIDMRADIG